METRRPINKDTVKGLYSLAQKHATIELKNGTGEEAENLSSEWNTKIGETNVNELIALTSLLSSREDSVTRRIKALRESVITEISFKNALQIATTMERLNKSASRLTFVSVFLSIIGVIVAVLQLVR